MISRIYRRSNELALGKLTLNISGCPEEGSEFREAVGALYTSLLPKVVLLPMTIQNLCSSNFLPTKDYATNKLSPSILQVGDGTVLVVDETALKAGNLSAEGTKNLQVLNSFLAWQKLPYDFTYHHMDFLVDVPSTIISCGKSMFASDARVQLKPTTKFQTPVATDGTTLDKCRQFIALFRTLDLQPVADDLSKIIQNDFVKLRKEDATILTDDFHLWLTLARFQALSFGEEKLTEERWKYTLSKENERRSRLK